MKSIDSPKSTRHTERSGFLYKEYGPDHQNISFWYADGIRTGGGWGKAFLSPVSISRESNFGPGILKVMNVRDYNSATDYEDIQSLYKNSATFGGEFDEARDSKNRLDTLEKEKPQSILVAEEYGCVVGTVTLFEDGRSAWLYRFAVQAENENAIAKLLCEKALQVMKERGHSQVLVYAPANDGRFEERYLALGFAKGDDYTAYWQDLN